MRRAGIVGILLFSACTGNVTGPAAVAPMPANGGSTAGPSDRPPEIVMPNPGPVTIPPPSACSGAAPDVGPTRVRFLTRTEYERTVRDLFRMPALQIPALPPDGSFHYAQANVAISITESSGDLYMRAAADVASRAVANLPALSPCADGEPCARQFIESFGARAFRRPPTATQIEGLLKVFRTGRTFTDGIRLVLEAILQSGSFLYRLERTEAGAGDVRPLDGYSVASRLSYLLWSSMPDDALLAAAARKELRTREQIAAQVERMLKDPRARDGYLDFYRRWLGLDALATVEKDNQTFPQWGPALKASMAAESDALLAKVLWEGDGRLATLLTTRDARVDGTLAALYGLTAVKGATTTQLDAKRAGIMTRAAFLAASSTETETNPVHLGLFLRERVLCGTVAPPTVMVEPPDPASGKTARERFAQHSASPACAPCHALMDPLGLAFENYDAIGRHRTTENDKPIDASGDLVGAGDASGPFRDALELIQRLSASREVRSCLVRQWFRYTLARDEAPQDACSLAALDAAGEDLRGLPGALATSDAFLHARR